MSYNIHNAIGMDNIADYQRIADVITKESPDVVALQELDSVTERSQGINVLREIAEKAQMYYVFGSSIDFQGGKYGLGVMSKEKPLNHYSVELPGREEKRQLLVVEFKKFVLGCTHLSLTADDRMASIAVINREAAKTDKPFFLAGDWNDMPESELLKEIQKQFTLLSSPAQFTFPSKEPNRCIDYIAIFNGSNQHDKKTSVMTQKVVDEKIASDHCPIWVDLRFSSGK